MRLEFVRIDEANDLLNHLIEHHPHAIFVTNHDFEIEYSNKSFQKLAKREKHEIHGKEFCHTMGCIYEESALNPEKSICKTCRMRDILSGSNISELDMIRDFKIHNEVVTKHLYMESSRIVMNGKKLNIVILEDRTNNH